MAVRNRNKHIIIIRDGTKYAETGIPSQAYLKENKRHIRGRNNSDVSKL